MTVILFVTGALLVGVMIGEAAYGWVSLPADAWVPIHHGLGGYNNFVPKKAGLITWPALGALVFGLLVGVREATAKPHHASPTVALMIMLAALALVAAFEWGAIAAARKNGRPPRLERITRTVTKPGNNHMRLPGLASVVSLANRKAPSV